MAPSILAAIAERPSRSVIRAGSRPMHVKPAAATTLEAPER